MKNNLPTHLNDFYTMLYKQLESLLDGEYDKIANLANTSALLAQSLEEINWVGFYLIKEGDLILGPFQGKVACMHIGRGKGVCGRAVVANKTQRIADVHAFEGHIACDQASCSELVIPIRQKGEVIGVLDIDSPRYNRFSEDDQLGLEALVGLLEHLPMWD